MKGIPPWIFTDVFLFLLASVCCFILKGYSFLGYAMILAACMIVAYNLLPAALWKIIVVIVAVCAAYFCIIEVPIVLNARSDKECGKPYVVVLGAEVVGRRPSRSLNYRINAAYEYLTAYPESTAVLSGGQGEGEDISEAECMFEKLKEKGISPDRMLIEDASTSTQENLRYSFKLIRDRGAEPDGNTAVVSSNYHLFRAKHLAKLQGVKAAGYAAYPGNPFLAANFFIREAFGVTRLLVLGY